MPPSAPLEIAGTHVAVVRPSPPSEPTSDGEGRRSAPRCQPCASRPVQLRDPYHQPHLQNFFDAVRGKGKLNCPAEVGYESAVSVLKVNEAIEAKSRLSFKADDFHV